MSLKWSGNAVAFIRATAKIEADAAQSEFNNLLSGGVLSEGMDWTQAKAAIQSFYKNPHAPVTHREEPIRPPAIGDSTSARSNDLIENISPDGCARFTRQIGNETVEFFVTQSTDVQALLAKVQAAMTVADKVRPPLQSGSIHRVDIDWIDVTVQSIPRKGPQQSLMFWRKNRNFAECYTYDTEEIMLVMDKIGGEFDIGNRYDEGYTLTVELGKQRKGDKYDGAYLNHFYWNIKDIEVKNGA